MRNGKSKRAHEGQEQQAMRGTCRDERHGRDNNSKKQWGNALTVASDIDMGEYGFARRVLALLGDVRAALGCDGIRIQRTLDVGHRLRVKASHALLVLGFTGIVDVECLAARVAVADLCALCRVEVRGLEDAVSEVAFVIGGAEAVNKGAAIACGGGRIPGGLAEGAAGVKVLGDAAIAGDGAATGRVSRVRSTGGRL
jgi:hypothetical protein